MVCTDSKASVQIHGRLAVAVKAPDRAGLRRGSKPRLQLGLWKGAHEMQALASILSP